ncbi:hypothetical protein M3Y99_00061100 [Aphelenchoides fujianensis]|nr:hypothetical protein M3Y99_00061100 [Aphelenchoides fujianensis]
MWRGSADNIAHQDDSDLRHGVYDYEGIDCDQHFEDDIHEHLGDFGQEDLHLVTEEDPIISISCPFTRPELKHDPAVAPADPSLSADEKLLRRRKKAADARRLRRQQETHRATRTTTADDLRKDAAESKQVGLPSRFPFSPLRLRGQQQAAQQQQSFQKEYLNDYEVDQTVGNSQGHAYAQGEPVQIVAMPQHQAVYHQPTSSGQYRQSHQQPTIITVPIPASTAGSGPFTIHVTLPEHMQLAGQNGQPQILAQVPQQQLHVVPTGSAGGANGQLVLTQDNYGNHQPMHVIRIQTQPSPAAHQPAQPTAQPQQIIIHQSAQQQPPPPQVRPPPQATSSSNRPVPHRFRNLTDEQIARRRKANAERSRRRRAMETAEQRAERNRRTAERMRQRRAKIAEERGIVRTSPRTSSLSADRFEEIYQSVVQRNLEEATKEEPLEMSHLQPMNGPPGHPQHIIVAASPHQAAPGQQVIYRTQPMHHDRQYIYQPAQGGRPVQQQLVVQSGMPQQQMNRL